MVEIPVKTVERVTEKLVPVEVPADSALLQALFYCDSLYQVQLLQLDELKSERMLTVISFESGDTSQLTYRAKKPPNELQVPVTTVEITEEKPVKAVVPIVEYRMNSFQKFFYRLGIMAAVGLIIYIGLKIRR